LESHPLKRSLLAQWLEPLLEQLALSKDHRTLVMPTLDIIPEAFGCG